MGEVQGVEAEAPLPSLLTPEIRAALAREWLRVVAELATGKPEIFPGEVVVTPGISLVIGAGQGPVKAVSMRLTVTNSVGLELDPEGPLSRDGEVAEEMAAALFAWVEEIGEQGCGE